MIKYYKDKLERDSILATENQLGKSMIHDDFIDVNNNPTNGKSGRLTFDTIPNPDLTDFNRKKN